MSRNTRAGILIRRFVRGVQEEQRIDELAQRRLSQIIADDDPALGEFLGILADTFDEMERRLDIQARRLRSLESGGELKELRRMYEAAVDQAARAEIAEMNARSDYDRQEQAHTTIMNAVKERIAADERRLAAAMGTPPADGLPAPDEPAQIIINARRGPAGDRWIADEPWPMVIPDERVVAWRYAAGHPVLPLEVE